MPFSRHIHIFLSVGSILSISLLPSLTFASPLSSANTLAGEGIISSQSSESGYRLSSPISRGEMMKVAVKLAGKEQKDCRTSSIRNFSDVTTSLGDLCGYIETALQAGMIQRGTTFRPTAFVTRAEMTKILVNALGLGTSTTPSGFTDISGLGDLAGYINRVAELGCAGSTNTLFRPKAPATRGEVFDMAVCLKNQSTTTSQLLGTTSTSSLTSNDASLTTNNSNSTTSTTTNTSSSSYLWSTSSYGICSKTCGEGVQTRTVTCKNTMNNQVVADSYCMATGIVKPVTQKICNAQMCGGSISIISPQNTTISSQALPSINTSTSSLLLGTGNILKDTTGLYNGEKDSGRGLWVPKSNPNLFVVDPSLLGNQISVMAVIPCFMNGKSWSNSWDCLNKYNMTGKFTDQNGILRNISLKKGIIISMRFRTVGKDALDATRNFAYFTRASFDGGTYSSNIIFALSENPGDFNVEKGCIIPASDKTSPLVVGTLQIDQNRVNDFNSSSVSSFTNIKKVVGTTTYCNIKPNTNYYLNMQVDEEDAGYFQLHNNGPFSKVLVGGHTQPTQNTQVYNPPQGISETQSTPNYGSCTTGGIRYYKSNGCNSNSVRFSCTEGKLIIGSQFSPAPILPIQGEPLFMTQTECGK